MRNLFFVVLLAFIPVLAQDVRVNGNSSATEVFKSTNTSTTSSDRIGVHGVSTPAANWGIGVQGTGAWKGVVGASTTSGSGSRFGGDFIGQNATGENYGVSGIAFAGNSSSKYGVKGFAFGDGGTKYGVYGSASGSGTNYGVYCYGNGGYTGSWSSLSDARIKNNIREFSGALEKIGRLRAKQYETKKDYHPGLALSGKTQFGLIAQEVETVLPEVVTEMSHPVPAEGKDGNSEVIKLKGVDYIALVPVLIQAIQEQQAQIEGLRAQIQPK